MNETAKLSPRYADRFQCIGSACEDTCCGGWSVPVDKATWHKYQQLAPGPLRVLVQSSLEQCTSAAGEPPSEAVFGRIRMDAANQCPMLTPGRLCGIQSALGEELLSHACATYPRIVHRVGAAQEKALSLSCPEAARLVLLSPDLLSPDLSSPDLPRPDLSRPDLSRPDLPRAESLSGRPIDDGSLLRIGSAAPESANFVPADFWPVRSAVLRLIANRAYPLWQRLFLLGVLCRRLDAMDRETSTQTVAGFLAGFEATVAGGVLRASMDSMPLDLAAQLDIVLRLAGLMLHRSNVRARFVESVQAFTAGIGNGPGATLESLTAQYRRVHDRFFDPFIRRHPYILENYLANTVVRTQFPFGKEGMKPGAVPDRTREFALLTAQFALTRGLLIGVAGFHGDAFDTPHIVQSVQSAAKHFEHHPDFLKLAHEQLVESRMDGARGLAILLRNTAPAAVSHAAMPAFQEKSAPAPRDGRSASAAGRESAARPA